MPAGLLHVSFYVARQKRRLVFALVASSLALSLGHAGLAWAAARLLWALLTPGRAPGPLGALALGALAAAALKALGATLLAGAEALFVAAVALDYRRRLVGALLGRGTRRADEAAIARLLAALAALERACAAGLFGGLRALLHLVPVVAVALRFTPWFALGLGLAWAPLLFVLGRARKRLRRGEADALGRSARVAHRVDEIFRHVDLWRTHGAGRSLARALERDAHEVGRASSSAAALRASLSGLNEVMAAAAVALVVALGPRMAGGAGAPGLEDTVVFLALVFWAYRPFRDWLDARAAWQGGRAALELLEPWLEPEREATFEPPSHHDVAGEANDPVGLSSDRADRADRADLTDMAGRGDRTDSADLNDLANAEGESVGPHASSAISERARDATDEPAGADPTDRVGVVDASGGPAGVGPPAEARDGGVGVVPASVTPSGGGGGPFVGRAPLAVKLERFGARRHHARWSLTLRPGSLVVIAGPTGSGKTTLVRALLGLEEARGGLWYGDASLRGAGVGPLARPFAWAPQGAPLVAGTLADNLLPAEGVSPREAWASLEALRGAGAPSWREDEPLGAVDRQLSGGERAWVAIARAAATRLPVLLLDEPTANLDAASARRVHALLAGLRGERTLVVVTHRHDLRELADEVVEVPAPAAEAGATGAKGAVLTPS